MGAKYTYQEAGQWHADTVAYNDEDELKKIGRDPKKITQIRVWSSEYIVGIEVFYDNISAGARMGTEYLKGTIYQDFALGHDEDIKLVKGRSGALIDQVTFKTTKGREASFGTSKGGKKFKMKDAAGRIVKGFKIGFGGHLHSLGVWFSHKDYSVTPAHVPTHVPSPFPTPIPAPTPGSAFPTSGFPVPTPVPFGSSGTTTTKTTTTKTRGVFGHPVSVTTTKTTTGPTSMHVPAPAPVSFPTPTPVSFPTQPTYPPAATHTMPTHSIPTPFPTATPVPSYPASIPVVTHIPAPAPVSTYPTHVPAPAPVSTYPTHVPAPAPVSTYPTHVPAPAPIPTYQPHAGVTITQTTTAPTYTPAAYAPTSVPMPMPTPMPIIPTFTKSNVVGKVHPDTISFDDYASNQATLTASTSVRMSELRVLHNSKFIFGFEAIYDAGVQVSGGQHVGNEMDHTCVNQSVPLAYGETITAISGKHGNVIDSINITTSTGKIYSFGGSGGKFSYSVFIPAGKTVRAIAGGLGGHLHHLSVYYT